MKKSILIIGAGGIGGLLLDYLSRSIAFSGPLKANITIMDGDIVERRNLPHQPFSYTNIGDYKVTSLVEHFSKTGIFTEQGIEIHPITSDFSDRSILDQYDLVVVAVDREKPRNIVHSYAEQWLDIRARGDGFVMWSNLDDFQVLQSLPKLPEGVSTSCQLDEAIELGNIQFGFALAAAHGAQWIVQWLRGASTPPGRIYSIHMGQLPLPELLQELDQ